MDDAQQDILDNAAAVVAEGFRAAADADLADDIADVQSELTTHNQVQSRRRWWLHSKRFNKLHLNSNITKEC